MSSNDKLQPWKSTWPQPGDTQSAAASDQGGQKGEQTQEPQEVLDYGLLKGVTIILDGASHGDLSHDASCGGKCKLCVSQRAEATRLGPPSASADHLHNQPKKQHPIP